MDHVTLALTIGAAARLTRLAVSDAITEPARTAITARIAQPRRNRRAAERGEPIPPPTPARAWALTLAGCHWCLGFWITGATIATAYAFATHPAWQATALVLSASYLVGWLADNERDT